MDQIASFAEPTALHDEPEIVSARPVPANDLPLFDPNRPELKLRPLKAWHHFRELLKDKENTEEVFKIFEALPWKGVRPRAERFLNSPEGQAIRASEPFLPDILDDHEALRKLPAGTVAHHYCDFMERENLTAAGLVAESLKFRGNQRSFNDQFTWYLDRLRDTHDLLHVLTGYGRDALGEQCVLAFTYGQQPAPGNLFISYLAGLETVRRLKSKAPVMGAIREAQRLGTGCPRLVEQPIRDILAMPYEDARRRLNITMATKYTKAHRVWRGLGYDPYDLLAPRKLAA